MVEAKTQVILAGATGLIGGHIAELLSTHPHVDKVFALTRQATAGTGSKIEMVTADYDRLEELDIRTGKEVVGVCALGTTQKKAGSKEAFRKVDFDYIVGFGKLCRRLGAGQLHVISSIGADKSSLSFYLKVKGETEQALKDLGIPVLSLYRPSLLLGDRDEYRPAEVWGGKIMRAGKFLFSGPLKNYKPIEAETVARAVVNRLSAGPEEGAGKTGRTTRGVVHVLESTDIEAAARA